MASQVEQTSEYLSTQHIEWSPTSLHVISMLDLYHCSFKKQLHLCPALCYPKVTHLFCCLKQDYQAKSRNNSNWNMIRLTSHKDDILLTVLSSWRSCWFKFVDSSKRASKAAIFSSFISRDFLRVDSNFDSKSLYLSKDVPQKYVFLSTIISGYLNLTVSWSTRLNSYVQKHPSANSVQKHADALVIISSLSQKWKVTIKTILKSFFLLKHITRPKAILSHNSRVLTLLGELVCVCWHHPPFSGSTPANPAGTATKFKCEVFGEQDFHQFPFPACSNRGGIRDGEQFFTGAYSLDAWVCELLTQPSCCYFKTVTTPDIWRFYFFLLYLQYCRAPKETTTYFGEEWPDLGYIALEHYFLKPSVQDILMHY